MDLVWKYPKHVHFQGFPTETRWASCKNTPKQIHPESQSFNLRPSSYFCCLIFTNVGVFKKVTKFSNSRVYWLKPSQPSPCTPMRKSSGSTGRLGSSEHPALSLEPVPLFTAGMWTHTPPMQLGFVRSTPLLLPGSSQSGCAPQGCWNHSTNCTWSSREI